MIHISIQQHDFLFFLFLHFYISSSASRGWRKWTVQVIPVCKKNIFSAVQFSQSTFDRQPEVLNHAAPQSLCARRTDYIDPIRSESRAPSPVPAKRWWPATISFWLWDPLPGSSSHTSMTTVSFRCLGSFARCGFSVRVCQTSTCKREEEEEGVNVLTVEMLGTK